MSGIKYDGNKAPMALIPLEAVAEIAKVLAFGAKKYGPWQWAGGMDHSRLLAATLRHLTEHSMGVDRDAESGELHTAHAACNLLFLLYMQLHGVGTDDRHKRGGQ